MYVIEIRHFPCFIKIEKRTGVQSWLTGKGSTLFFVFFISCKHPNIVEKIQFLLIYPNSETSAIPGCPSV